MECDRSRAPSREGVSLTLPSPLQSLAMLKDGFRTDRGSHSDLWSSSSSLESSSFPLSKQYLDVSSQTDISGGVSRQGVLLGCCDGRPPSPYSPEELAAGSLWGWLLTQPSGAPFSSTSPGPRTTGDDGVEEKPTGTPCSACCLATCWHL